MVPPGRDPDVSLQYISSSGEYTHPMPKFRRRRNRSLSCDGYSEKLTTASIGENDSV
jgi:hypothetical protein